MILNRLHEITILKEVKTKNECGEYEKTYEEDHIIKVQVQYLEDQASVELYGRDIKKTRRLTTYKQDMLKEFDSVKINNEIYMVISVKIFSNHNVVDVQKV